MTAIDSVPNCTILISKSDCLTGFVIFNISVFRCTVCMAYSSGSFLSSHVLNFQHLISTRNECD